MAAFSGSQDPLNTPTAPSPLLGVHEHAGPSFLFPTKGSNNLAHASSVFPKRVPLHLLEKITNGFSKDRVIGVGAYGKVYKVLLVQFKTHTWFPGLTFSYHRVLFYGWHMLHSTHT
jgi:hypothetical protein